MRSSMLTTARAVLITGGVLLAAGVAEAQRTPPGLVNNPAGPNPPGLIDNPGLSRAPGLVDNQGVSIVNASRIQSVPIPASTLILFGAGLLALPWLRARMAR